MQQKAKVSLSDLELQLVTDETFILTKNQIIQKVYTLFGQLSEQFAAHLQLHPLPAAVLAKPPKIAKGENYKGLPYVMLDYPRCFETGNVLAVRSFFWWGHYFSCTLHLKGIYKTQFNQQILNAQQHNAFTSCLISTGADEWNHDIDEGYTKLKEINTSEITAMNYTKLTVTHSLKEWDSAFLFFEKNFLLYLKLLNSQLPSL